MFRVTDQSKSTSTHRQSDTHRDKSGSQRLSSVCIRWANQILYNTDWRCNFRNTSQKTTTMIRTSLIRPLSVAATTSRTGILLRPACASCRNITSSATRRSSSAPSALTDNANKRDTVHTQKGNLSGMLDFIGVTIHRIDEALAMV